MTCWLILGEFLDPEGDDGGLHTPPCRRTTANTAWLTEHGFRIEKRSQMLGHLAEGKYVMAWRVRVTTSTMVAWLNRVLTGGGSGIFWEASQEFRGQSGVGRRKKVGGRGRQFDRSFLRLYPDVAVVTSADADHLDICNAYEAVKEALLAVRAADPSRRIPSSSSRGRHQCIDNPEITVYRYS